MIKINDEQTSNMILGEENIYDPIGLGMEPPKAFREPVNTSKVLKEQLLEMYKSTTNEYDRTENWSEVIFVKAERAVLSKVIQLIHRLEQGEV